MQEMYKELDGFRKLYEVLVPVLREYQVRVVPLDGAAGNRDCNTSPTGGKHRFRSAIRMLLCAVVFLGPLFKKLRKRV